MRFRSRPFGVAFVLLALGTLTAAYGQITPSGDAYTNTALPVSNFGAKPLLDVQSPSQTAFIQFDLSSVPAGYTSANLAKATLKLYVNAVPTAGSFNVDFVNGAWAENTISANLSPALGTTVASGVALTSANVHDYILIDVTSAVGAWLDGTHANDGLALVANSPLSASFDSKENTAQSHPPELEVVLTGSGTGTITGVTTASSSGLIGGGTSGTLNLSLTNACSSGQILQWNGSAWACSSAGSGTITGVIAGTGLSGGGTSGKVTLNLDTTRVPLLAGANEFTNQQSITTASGTSLFVDATSIGDTAIFGANTASTGNSIGVLGFSVGGSGVVGSTSGSSGLFNGAAAVVGDTRNYFGVWGLSALNDGVHGINGSGAAGVAGENKGQGFGVWAIASNPNTYGVGVRGESFGNSFFPNGNGSDGVDGFAHSTNGSGVAGINTTDGPGVYGHSSGGAGFVTDSNVTQSRNMGGWLKAMAFVDPFAPGGIAVTRCFNSQMSGAAMSTPPCGMAVVSHFQGINVVDFGFEVDDRFISITAVGGCGNFFCFTVSANIGSIPSPNQEQFTTLNSTDGSTMDVPFSVFVY